MNIKSEEMTNFTIKIDKKTREDYSELCKEIGLSMSAATLALIRQAVRSQSMRRRMEDVKKGIVEMHPLVGEDE